MDVLDIWNDLGYIEGLLFTIWLGILYWVSVSSMQNLSETLLQGISKKLDRLLELMKELIRMLGRISKK